VESAPSDISKIEDNECIETHSEDYSKQNRIEVKPDPYSYDQLRSKDEIVHNSKRRLLQNKKHRDLSTDEVVQTNTANNWDSSLLKVNNIPIGLGYGKNYYAP
jgi:hypothetical protein